MDEIDAAIAVVRDRVRAGKPDPNRTPHVDARDVEETKADLIEGRDTRDPDRWRQVMQAHGYRWLEPSQLNATVGPLKVVPPNLDGLTDAYGRPLPNPGLYQLRPHTVGQWRRETPWRSAYTLFDLCSLFVDPEVFDRWIKNEDAKRRMKRAGLVFAR